MGKGSQAAAGDAPSPACAKHALARQPWYRQHRLRLHPALTATRQNQFHSTVPQLPCTGGEPDPGVATATAALAWPCGGSTTRPTHHASTTTTASNHTCGKAGPRLGLAALRGQEFALIVVGFIVGAGGV